MGIKEVKDLEVLLREQESVLEDLYKRRELLNKSIASAKARKAATEKKIKSIIKINKKVDKIIK